MKLAYMKDLVLGLAVSVLGILIVLLARQMRSPVPGFGPDVFPSAIGILLAIFGGILTVQGLARKEKIHPNGETHRLRSVFFMLLLTAGYIVSLQMIPFLISTPVYLITLTLMSKAVKEGKVVIAFDLRLLAFVVIVSGMIYFVFNIIFSVALI